MNYNFDYDLKIKIYEENYFFYLKNKKWINYKDIKINFLEIEKFFFLIYLKKNFDFLKIILWFFNFILISFLLIFI
jgi:hypothetical protein